MDARGETSGASPSRLALILAAGLPVRLVEQTLIVGFSPHRDSSESCSRSRTIASRSRRSSHARLACRLPVTTVLQPMRSGQRRDHEGTILRGR